MAQQREIFLAIFLACVARVRSESSCLVQLRSDSATAIGALGSPFSRQQKQCIDDYVSNVKMIVPNYTLEGEASVGRLEESRFNIHPFWELALVRQPHGQWQFLPKR